MRHVSADDFSANSAELTAALGVGDEVVVTMGDHDYQLVSRDMTRPDDAATIAKRAAALEELRRFRAKLRAKGVRVTPADVREWIDEGRP